MAAKDKDGVITGVYKVNLHCPQCARRIKKPLLRTQGVQSVDVDFEKAEIKVKGVIDVIKIQKSIENSSKRKVELISPLLKIKETTASATSNSEMITKDIKEKKIKLRTTTVKVHIHCDQCEQDLRKKLLKHKGIYSVKTDPKAETITVQGSIESDSLLSYLRKKVHKHAEIVTSKIVEKKEDVKRGKAKVSEFKEEVKSKEISNSNAAPAPAPVPYFIHYVYAPQLFSDENPDACSIL